MDRWYNKVAVVTGASKGIGAAITQAFLKNGIQVVGLARHIEPMEQMKKELPAELQHKFSALKCNVSDLHWVNEAFDEIESKCDGIDILVNSAGLFHPQSLLNGDISFIQEMLLTNVMGVVHCNQRAYKSMRDRNFDGHIFIINSIGGHNIPIAPKEVPPMVGMYVASKWSLKAMAEIYRQEFRHFDTKIKITTISPGATDTPFLDNYLRDYTDGNFLNAEDVAHSVLYALGTPTHVQVHDLIVKPVAEFVL
ncbi:farnesol dehydrogenase [Stomoxys calcitrans]|uniref:farnesol dehydrogenase n=1 Tax=Stomoxys calcitrans TaxID=35570 RepID=UPI0027E39EA1|nr:farnesol dehydrogenase [Stomoxys calcitrans]